MKLEDDSYCFACGSKNPIGLKLKFEPSEDSLVVNYTPDKYHQGYKNILHGGIASVILDEVMARFLIDVRKIMVVTAKMEIKFRKPVSIEETVRATAKYVSKEGNFHIVKGELRTQDGTLLVSAEGTFAEIKD